MSSFLQLYAIFNNNWFTNGRVQISNEMFSCKLKVNIVHIFSVRWRNSRKKRWQRVCRRSETRQKWIILPVGRSKMQTLAPHKWIGNGIAVTRSEKTNTYSDEVRIQPCSVDAQQAISYNGLERLPILSSIMTCIEFFRAIRSVFEFMTVHWGCSS